MHAPIEHEQAYTPPEDTDTITDGTDIIDNADSQDLGEQTTNQPQPATAGAR